MHLLPVAILWFREIARSNTMEHHPAPHPVGGEQHQDLVTTLSISPFPAPWWKAQAKDRKRWRNIIPTATQSVAPPTNHTTVRLPVCLTMSALRPPTQQYVGDYQMVCQSMDLVRLIQLVHYALGRLWTITRTVSLHLSMVSLSLRLFDLSINLRLTIWSQI